MERYTLVPCLYFSRSDFTTRATFLCIFPASFGVFPNLVKTRNVALLEGLAIVYCSQWRFALEELFKQHYYVGLSVMENTCAEIVSQEVQWTLAMDTLDVMYRTYMKRKPSLKRNQVITARHIDAEQKYFPPCMWLLLAVLRARHRLTYQWRYKFALFLKDIGLSVEENIKFWENEYSKSCSSDSSCKHTWGNDAGKYVYSTRHIYGLEGKKKIQKSKDCGFIQVLTLGWLL